VYGSVNFILNTSAGAYNSLTTPGDALLFFTKGSVNSGCMTIAPHNSGNIGIRIASTANTFTAGANTHSFVSNTSGTAMMTIAGNGTVGIGTTNPQAPLHIYKSGTGGIVQGEIRVCSDDNQKSRVGMYEESAGSTWGCWMQYNGNGDTMEFGTKRNTVDSSPQMTISSTGYISYPTTYKYNIFYAPPNWSYGTSATGWQQLWSFSYTLPQTSYVTVSMQGHWQASAVNMWAYIAPLIGGNSVPAVSSYFDSWTAGASVGNGGTFHDYWSGYGWQGFSCTFNVKLTAGTYTFGQGISQSGGTVYVNGSGITLHVIPVNYL
jgi:hypothetical protein